MQFEQIIMLSILMIIALLTSLVVMRRHKKNDNSNVNILLLEYITEIMDLSKSALRVLETERENFQSDREFYDALSAVVMKDLRDFLSEKTELHPKVMDLLTEENLSEIVYVVMYQLKKFIAERETIDKINKELTEEVYVEEQHSPININKDTVDILPELNNIIENSNSIDPWTNNEEDYL